jgi:hypothetical protein
MKHKFLNSLMVAFGSFIALSVYAPVAFAQVASIPDTSKMAYNQISNTAKLYVFPSKGQSKNQQKKDEFECYQWAVEQSGIDPLNLPKVAVQPTQTGPDGSAVRGAAKGAVLGAAIGAVTGNAGEGAAVGAIAGGAGGLGQRRATQARKQQQAQADAAHQEQAMKDSFKKAFSACIEGKGYTIK